MPSYESFFVTLHHIDFNSQSDEVNEVINIQQEEDLANYVNAVISDILDGKNIRSFEKNSANTEVISCIQKGISIEPVKTDFTKIIAKRLLRTERETQEKYKQITEIQKGSLVQCFLKLNNELMYLLAKIEHDTFIDEGDLKRHFGLPYEKRVLKTCLIQLTDDKQIADIRLYDTNSTIAQYWWEKFLELKKLTSDEENTKRSFYSIDSCLSKIKKDFPTDYTILRNSVIGYYKNQTSFVFDNLIDTVFSNYQPEDTNLDMIKLKNNINQLPDDKKFERRFEIIPKEIKARIRKIYSIHDKVDLNVKDYIENMKNVIIACEEPEGKFIKIRSTNDEVFNMFKFNR